MSTKSARPVKTKQDNLVDKVKNTLNEFWDNTTQKAEELKEIAADKIETIRDGVINVKSTSAKKTTVAKPLVSDRPKASTTTGKAKIAKAKTTAAEAATHPKAESVKRKPASKKSTVTAKKRVSN
jgi:hypothetical protein